MSISQKLVRDNVRALTPYASARRIASGGNIWLNANESPYVDSYELTDPTLNLYPQCQPVLVLKRYAQYAGVSTDELLVSRGADEGIELLIKAYCEPEQDSILICPPTYGMYAISAETQGVAIETIPVIEESLELNIDAIAQALAKEKCPNLVFICSPNNPTGNVVPQQQIVEVLELAQSKAIVVVDEAYIEFAPQTTAAGLLKQYPNLVVLRTLSKAFALAGLRCGFTLASAEIITTLLKVIAPYPVSTPVADIAAQALSDQGIETMKQRVDILNEQRELLAEFLVEQPQCTDVFESDANFIITRWVDAQAVYQALVAKGILIRDQSKQRYLDNSLRFTIGSPEQMQAVVNALTEYTQEDVA